MALENLLLKVGHEILRRKDRRDKQVEGAQLRRDIVNTGCFPVFRNRGEDLGTAS